MFQRFMHIAKTHTMWIVGGVIAVVLLIYLMSRGSGSSGGGIVAYGPSDTVVLANAQKEIALLNANAATAQAQLANEKSVDDNQAAIKLNEQNVGAATAIVASNNAAAVMINDKNVVGATQINAQNTDAAKAIAAIQANTAAQIAGFNTDLAIHELNVNKEVALNDNSVKEAIMRWGGSITK